MKAEDVKIVFPLDVASAKEARKVLTDVALYVDMIKVGKELDANIGLPAALALTKEFGKENFADLKIIDIPNTVMGAVKGVIRNGADFLNVMALGGEAMMAAAVKTAGEMSEELGRPRTKIIAVTILTSQTWQDLVKMGFAVPAGFNNESKEEQQAFVTSVVMRLAQMAVNAGVDCVLSSAREAEAIHQRWSDIDIACPGIRLPDSPPDDQERKMTPGEAALMGVRYLVIGRPIRNPVGGKTRQQVIAEIRADIAQALGA